MTLRFQSILHNSIGPFDALRMLAWIYFTDDGKSIRLHYESGLPGENLIIQLA